VIFFSLTWKINFSADSKLSVSTWAKSVLAMSTMNPREGGEKKCGRRKRSSKPYFLTADAKF